MNRGIPEKDRMLLQRVWRYVRENLGIYYQKSYSQCGEDLIIRYIMNTLGIARPGYLDIGAHHPYFMSNSYLFYRQGCKGVCVEPDPFLFRRFKKARRRDVCLNVGLAGVRGQLKLHVFSSRTLNTFSEEEARQYIEAGHNQVALHDIDVLTVDDVVRRYFPRPPDLVSLDVEGMEMEILRAIDFSRYRPTVFCIETLTYSRIGEGRKVSEIDDYMINHGYMKYADTYVNSIYVDEECWHDRS